MRQIADDLPGNHQGMLVYRRRGVAKVVHLYPCADIPKMLRQLADDIERDGVDPADSCTVVYGPGIYCFGPTGDAQAAQATVFDLNYAIYQLMRAGHGDD